VNHSSPRIAVEQPEPTDAEYLRIKELESRRWTIDAAARRHKLVIATEQRLRHARPDSHGMLHAGWDALDVRVSKSSVERALNIMNAVITSLEAEKFPVILVREKHSARVQIFGHAIPFGIIKSIERKPS
jgi:hypothetical protein